MKDKRKGDIKKACNLPQYAYNMINISYGDERFINKIPSALTQVVCKEVPFGNRQPQHACAVWTDVSARPVFYT